MNNSDYLDLDQIVKKFYDLFTNAKGRRPKVESMPELFIAQGILIGTKSEETTVYTLNEFITPRIEILTNGSLTEFNEHELSHKTTITSNMASRISSYTKSGVLNGSKFKSNGTKSFQFIKIDNIWKIAYVSWIDHD